MEPMNGEENVLNKATCKLDSQAGYVRDLKKNLRGKGNSKVSR